LEAEKQPQEAAGSSLTPNRWKRAHRKGTTIVESEVRRSSRLKDANKGFKSNGCSDKRCLACAPDPPIIKNEVIKNSF